MKLLSNEPPVNIKNIRYILDISQILKVIFQIQ